MKSKNYFVRAVGDDLERLEEEYAFIGRYTKRVEGGLSIIAIQPGMKKNSSGDWVWVFPKPKAKVAPRPKRRDEDAERPKPSREQKPKSRA